MTKREKAHMKKQAEIFLQYYNEEMREAKKASDPEEKKEHYYQADLNFTAYNTIDTLLDELEQLTTSAK